MEPADLFQQANEILKARIAEAARFEGHEAFDEAQPHVKKLSAALETAQKQVADSMEKAKAAQASARAAQASAKAMAAEAQAKAHAAQAASGAAAAAQTARVAGPAVPFEDAQDLDPRRIQETIHTLLRGRAKQAAAAIAMDDRDIAEEAWVDPEIPAEAAPNAPAPAEPETPPVKKRKRRSDDSDAMDSESSMDSEIWEDLDRL